MLEKLGFAGN